MLSNIDNLLTPEKENEATKQQQQKCDRNRNGLRNEWMNICSQHAFCPPKLLACHILYRTQRCFYSVHLDSIIGRAFMNHQFSHLTKPLRMHGHKRPAGSTLYTKAKKIVRCRSIYTDWNVENSKDATKNGKKIEISLNKSNADTHTHTRASCIGIDTHG